MKHQIPKRPPDSRLSEEQWRGFFEIIKDEVESVAARQDRIPIISQAAIETEARRKGFLPKDWFFGDRPVKEIISFINRVAKPYGLRINKSGSGLEEIPGHHRSYAF